MSDLNIHVLKTWPEAFQAVWDRKKVAEFRRNDRDFQEGDVLELMEYDPNSGRLSGREISALVTHVLRGPRYGVPDGYAMLSMQLIRATDHGGVAWEILPMEAES